MPVRVTVDRIEGEIAVLEVDGTRVDWPRASLPPDATEGRVYEVAFDAIEQRDAEARARLDRLEAKGPPGDLIDL